MHTFDSTIRFDTPLLLANTHTHTLGHYWNIKYFLLYFPICFFFIIICVACNYTTCFPSSFLSSPLPHASFAFVLNVRHACDGVSYVVVHVWCRCFRWYSKLRQHFNCLKKWREKKIFKYIYMEICSCSVICMIDVNLKWLYLLLCVRGAHILHFVSSMHHIPNK